MQDILIEMTVYDPAIPGTKTLRYSCFGYTTKPTDTPANAYYEPRIKNPASLKLMLFGDGTTSGASQIGYGEVVLVNNDGMLDPLLNYGMDGRDIMIKQLTLAGTLLMVLGCSMDQPTFSPSEIAVRVKDPQARLNVPIQPHKYAGDNVLPNGLEGNDDLNGKPKPLIFGIVSNATPVLVNSSKLIYQIHDGVIDGSLAIYDKGVLLTEEDDYNSNADMLATAPSPGCYKAQYQTGYFRLGSSPSGQVTFDGGELAGGASTGSAMYVASRAADIAIPGVSIEGAGALYSLTSACVGIYVSEERTVASVMDDALGSIGAWYAFDNSGVLHFGRLDEPTGDPVATLSSIVDLNRQPPKDSGNGLPVWQVLLGYQKNYTVQTTDLAGALSTSGWNQYSLPKTSGWSGVAYGNGIFVAVASVESVCATSPDGVTWTQRTMPLSSYWNAVTYGNGLFVAASASDSAIATSPDGITWTRRYLPSTTSIITSIAYGNGVFVAVSYSINEAFTSPDGTTWTKRTLPTNATWASVTYGSGLFVAVAANSVAVAATSPDGITWTQRTMPSTATWYSVTYGNGTFVAVAASGTAAATSPDGITWTLRTLPTSALWYSVAYGAGYFVAVANGSKIAAISQDGITWTQVNQDTDYNWTSICFGNGAFISVSNGSGVVSVYNLTAPDARRQWLSKEYRTVESSDTTVKTIHLLAESVSYDTLLTDKTAAQAEADRRLALRKVRRDYVAVKVKRSALSTLPELGQVVSIKYPRYGYDSGKLFICIGMEIFLESDDVTLFLWG